jgi:hypothetical protein
MPSLTEDDRDSGALKNLQNIQDELDSVCRRMAPSANRRIEDESTESKLVSMRFQPDTLRNVEFLKTVTGLENRTQLAADAIALAAWYAARTKEGAEIYAEYPDGEREKVSAPRLEATQQDENRVVEIR